MNISITDLVLNGEKWNLEWLEAHVNHFLYETFTTLYKFDNTYAITSCEVTAEMIKWKLGYSGEWVLLSETSKFEDVYGKYPIFHITIGTDLDDINHIMTIINDQLIRSYYNKYPIKACLITKEIESDFKQSNYDKITNVSQNDDNLSMYYWIHITY